MNTATFAPLLDTLFREVLHGSPDPGARTYVLNQGDPGLLASLDRLSSSDASARHAGGASIAAHVDHLRYGFMLVNRWAYGAPPPWPDQDFTRSWQRNVVTETEWRELRAELRREAEAWAEALRTPREVSDAWARWMLGSVVHLSYHLGAIRQIDRATRGPTAEDEARAQAESRKP